VDDIDCSTKHEVPDDDVELTIRRLEGLQQGIAGILMPVSDGWRVHYFSLPTFDNEPGTTFSSFETAIEAIVSVLPAVNTLEEKARAGVELREYLDQWAAKCARKHPST